MAAEGRVEPHSYSGLLRHAVNHLAEKVIGRRVLTYTPPRKYTGTLTLCLKINFLNYNVLHLFVHNLQFDVFFMCLKF